MKSKVWLVLFSAVWFTGCVQYVSGYKKTGGGGAAEANPEDESIDDESFEGEEEATEDEESAEGPGAETLLSACETCHTEGEAGEKVVLDSTAIPRLDEAATGKNKDNHTSVADSFAEPTRADLEAELTAIGLRLKAKK